MWSSLEKILSIAVIGIVMVLALTSPTLAAVSNSNNYGVTEVQFGSGGELHACSTAYCAKQSLGELTVGNSRSTSYQAQGGFNTDRDPLLEVSVTGGTVNLGELTPASTSSQSIGFSVKTYLASGYSVYLAGTSPITGSGHVLTPMAVAGASQLGVEQFGVNLKLNTTPAVGANPVQVPDSSFSFGTPAAGYDTANSFKYVANDIIAGSASSSGQTNYTMSMIANVGTTTTGGVYRGKLYLNVIPAF